MTETFEDREKRFLRFHGDVPEQIRADYRRMLSEMPRDLYRAVVNHYARGGGITVAEKIRQVDPSLNPFYAGYTRGDPPRSLVQYTASGEGNTEIRSYEDRKRFLFHEIGHAVFSNYADNIARDRNMRDVATKTYDGELRRAGYNPADPQSKPVADYYLPGVFNGGNMRGAAKEAFCEMLSAQFNGGHHGLSREAAAPISIANRFPRMLSLVREATAGYIDRHTSAPQAAPPVTPQAAPPSKVPAATSSGTPASTPAERSKQEDLFMWSPPI